MVPAPHLGTPFFVHAEAPALETAASFPTAVCHRGRRNKTRLLVPLTKAPSPSKGHRTGRPHWEEAAKSRSKTLGGFCCRLLHCRGRNMRLVYLVVKTQPTTYCVEVLGRTPDIDILTTQPIVLAVDLFCKFRRVLLTPPVEERPHPVRRTCAPGGRARRHGGTFTFYRATLIIVKDTQNITLALPTDLLKRAKRLAAERDTSVSALLSAALGAAVDEVARYDGAHRRHLAALRKAADLGTKGRATWTRESLHDR
jgi:hypothetical protein